MQAQLQKALITQPTRLHAVSVQKVTKDLAQAPLATFMAKWISCNILLSGQVLAEVLDFSKIVFLITELTKTLKTLVAILLVKVQETLADGLQPIPLDTARNLISTM